jgi:hypothetical protein
LIIFVENKTEYRESIIKLWQICFGDSRDYIEFFLNNCPKYKCAADVENGEIVSMLFLLDGLLLNKKCEYIYAACTLPDCRRTGKMGALIEYSKKFCYNEGDSYIFLVPANDKLYKYYSNFGFINCFEKQRIIINGDHCDKSERSNLSKDFVRIKKELSEKLNGFVFTDNILDYTIKEHIFCGGKIIAIDNLFEKSIAFYRIEGNSIYIKELLSDIELNSEIINILIKKYNAENVYILCPIVYNSKNNESVSTKCGMVLDLNNTVSSDCLKKQAYYAGMYLD